MKIHTTLSRIQTMQEAIASTGETPQPITPMTLAFMLADIERLHALQAKAVEAGFESVEDLLEEAIPLMDSGCFTGEE